jgi:hypothetical protein
MVNLIHAFQNVNLNAITVVELAKRIRSQSDWSLDVAFSVAKALKEAYRLGEIRGSTVNR